MVLKLGMSDACDGANAVARAPRLRSAMTLADVIEERPVATLALALGLGFLNGATWRRYA